jgi:hypothetical protein
VITPDRGGCRTPVGFGKYRPRSGSSLTVRITTGRFCIKFTVDPGSNEHADRVYRVFKRAVRRDGGLLDYARQQLRALSCGCSRPPGCRMQELSWVWPNTNGSPPSDPPCTDFAGVPPVRDLRWPDPKRLSEPVGVVTSWRQTSRPSLAERDRSPFVVSTNGTACCVEKRSAST